MLFNLYGSGIQSITLSKSDNTSAPEKLCKMLLNKLIANNYVQFQTSYQISVSGIG